MSIKQSHNKRSRSHRKSVSQGIQHKKGLPKHGIQRRAGGKPSGSDSSRIASTCFLNKELKAVSPFVAFSSNDLVEILPIVYKCLKQCPDFKDDKEWKTLPTLTELADYLIQSIREVTPSGFDWMIKQNEGCTSPLYIAYYKHADVKDDYFGMPLEWLSELKAKDYHSYTLVCCVIAFISNESGAEVVETRFDEVFIYDRSFQDNGEEEETELNFIDAEKYKKGGVAYELRQEILTYFELHSKEHLINLITALPNKGSKLQKLVREWLQLAIPIIQNPPSLDAYVLNLENEYDGDYLSIKDSICFPYSFLDQVFINSEAFRNDCYSNTGYIEPVQWGAFLETRHVTPAEVEPLKNLQLFMKQGRHIYFSLFASKLEKQYDKRREHYGL